MKQVVSVVYYAHFLWLELESTGDTSIKQVYIWNVLWLSYNFLYGP